MPAWSWNAKAATIDPNSAALVATFLATCGPIGFFFPEVAEGVRVDASTPVFAVSTVGKPAAAILDPTIWVPVGSQQGQSTDHHFAIEDRVTGRWHDFQHASISGTTFTWGGGSSQALGAIQEPKGGGAAGGATAARVPLLQGAIHLSEVQAGLIAHALDFIGANIGPAPNRYPANSTTGYTTGNLPPGSSIVGHIPLGTWMRLPASLAPPGGMTAFELMVFIALQDFGMFCRDRGSDFTISGIDDRGGGQSFAAWRAAGVALNSTGVYSWTSAFKSALTHLEVLLPPGTPPPPPPPPSAPVAAFTYTPSTGSAPLTVNFTDASTPGASGTIVSRAWNFGDGGTSTATNPSHTFLTPGTYTVTEKVTGGGVDGVSSVSHTVIVTPAATNVLAANFLATPLTGFFPLTVTFHDNSSPGPSGPITDWAWAFGDGSTSTAENPAPKTYGAPGTYTVTLTVTGSGSDGTDTISHDITVLAPVPPPPPTPGAVSAIHFVNPNPAE